MFVLIGLLSHLLHQLVALFAHFNPSGLIRPSALVLGVIAGVL